MAWLMRGARGAGVRVLQRRLNKQISTRPLLDADGIFGARTDAAVRAFQQHRALTIDGIVGPETWGALRPSTSGARRVIQLPGMVFPTGRSDAPANATGNPRRIGSSAPGFRGMDSIRSTGRAGPAPALRDESSFLADLWHHLERFKRVTGLPRLPYDQAERLALRHLYIPGPPTKSDVFRVRSILQVWRSIWPGKTIPVATRYLDLHKVNRVLSNEGAILARLRSALPPGDHSVIEALANVGLLPVWADLADRERNALTHAFQRILDNHCTGHIHDELRAKVLPLRTATLDYNHIYSQILHWDTFHCFGMVAKVHWWITNSGFGYGHLALQLPIVAAGFWLATNYRTGIYRFYELQRRAVPVSGTE